MKRTIRLKCIKDPHIVDFVDAGIDREGNPSSQRQALTRVLSKRTTATIDGKEHTFPIFLVHDVGQWTLAAGEQIPGGDDWQSFEDDVIRREHSEEMLARWSKAQAKFIAESVDAAKQAAAQLEQSQSQDLARTMQAMMRGMTQQPMKPKVSA